MNLPKVNAMVISQGESCGEQFLIRAPKVMGIRIIFDEQHIEVAMHLASSMIVLCLYSSS